VRAVEWISDILIESRNNHLQYALARKLNADLGVLEFLKCYSYLLVMWRSLARKLVSFIPTGTRVRIFSGPLSGSYWYAGAAAGDGKGLSTCFNLCEPQQLELAANLSRKAETCFDIGANVGLYSILFARNSKRVYSFEPLPRNVSWLERTLAANGLQNVTLVPAAVSDEVGMQQFRQGANCAIGSIAENGTILILSVTLDAIVQKTGHSPDLLKIDVEGHELKVLKGGANTLRRRKPHILLSTHGAEVEKECLDYLKELGYTQFEPLGAAEFSIS
jgi:FkbM family methyltransferase